MTARAAAKGSLTSAFWCALILSTVLAQAQDPPLRFRKIFVPQHDIEELKRDYMPLNRQKFQELLADLDSQSKAKGKVLARVERAEYSAVLDGRQLIDGEAQLHVVHLADDVSLLPLAPCDLALGAATWHDQLGQQPATVGVDPQGLLVAIVDRSASLHMPWTANGQVNQLHEIAFDLTLAPSGMNRLRLQLPINLTPFVDRGVVFPDSDGNPSERDVAPRRTQGGNWWRIELGGATRVRLVLKPHESQRRRDQLVMAREDTRYELTDNGLNVRSDLQLDVYHEPLTQLNVAVPRELHIVSVRVGGIDTDWIVANGSGVGSKQLQIRLSKPLLGLGQTAEIEAIGPLQTDVSWQLPLMHMEAAFWQEGRLTLDVPEDLQLVQLTAVQARQVGVGPLEGDTGESHRFQLYAASGSLQVMVRRRQPEISVAVGTTIDPDPTTLTALTVADFRAQYGRRFVLEADVPLAWSIDGIESEPANAIDDYQLISHTTETQRLQIRLSSSLSTEKPLRIMVRTHRPPSVELHAEHFRPLQFRGVRRVEQVVAVAPDPSYRLEVTGDAEVTRLSPDDLRRANDDRIQPRAGGMIFVDDDEADSLAITITREDPTFSSRIAIEADGNSNTLNETYRINCVPETTPITRLLIQLSEPRDAPVEWQLLDQPDGILRQDLLTDPDERPARVGRRGETWQIVFRSPQRTTFDLVGKRQTPFTEKIAVSLATLPAAAVQDGWLTVSSSDGSQMTIDAQSVKAIPHETASPEQYTTSHGRFRYDPSRTAQVVLAPVRPQVGQTNTWAWNCQLTSHFEANGWAVHRAVFAVENTGGANIGVRLPAGCVVLGIEMDGAAIPNFPPRDRDGFVAIPLPKGQRYPRLEVTYTKSGERLGIWGQATTQFPELNVAVLSRNWTVWLPPGYQATNGNRNAWPLHERSYGWKQRVFGPLAAGPNQRPFRLFSAEDWASLFGRRGDRDPSSINAKLALQLLGEQLIDLRAAASDQPVTWRQLLDAYQHRVDASAGHFPAPMWVDQALFSKFGFSADSLVPLTPEATPSESAFRALVQSHLAIVAADDALLLTATDGLSRYAPSPVDVENRAVALACGPTPLSRRLHEPAEELAAGLVPLPSWLALPVVPASPWQLAQHRRSQELLNSQWRMYDVEIGSESECRLSIQRTTTLRAVGWAGMLIVAGMGAWLGLHQPRYLLLLIIPAVTLALLVPGSLVPVTSNLTLGTILATMLVAINSVPARLRRTRWSSFETSAVATTATVTALLLLLGWLLAATRIAQAQTGDNQRSSAPVYQVLIPIDDQLAPVGEYNYLPLEFYDEIHRRASQGGDHRGDWVIQSAGYRAVFAWREQRAALDMTDLIALYQIEVTRPQQRVTINWPGDAARRNILEARLGGQPAELLWNEAYTAFSVLVPQSGTNQLELVVRPHVQTDSSTRFVKMAIPAVNRSRVRIEAPMDAAGIEVRSRIGATQLDAESGEQIVEMGPATQLHIAWPINVAAASTTSQVEVSELKWLRVRPAEQPNSVMIDARYRFRAISGEIDELRLITDPRLRLRPVDREQMKLLSEPEIRTGESQVITWKLHEPVSGEITLNVQFWMTKTSGLGKLPLPRLEAGTGRVVRRWLAVSVSPDLEFTPAIDELLDPLDAAEFLTAWGTAKTFPDLTYRCLTADPVWSLATQARTSRTETRQQLQISVGQGAIDLVLRAQLETVDGDVFQHRLNVPAGFEVQSAVLISDDANLASHVENDARGNVTVFLTRGVTGEQRLEVRGRVAVDSDNGKIPFPRVTLKDTELRNDEIRLFRQSEVALKVEASPPLPKASQAAIGSFYDPLGRLVAAFDLTATDTTRVGDANLIVEPNRPFAEGRLVTTLVRTEDQWEASADLTVQINGSSGVIDKLRLAVPAEWTGPFTIEPPLDYQLRTIPDPRNVRQLVIRCPQPVANGLRILIRGQLDLSTSDSFHSLDIMPLDLDSVDRFLILPTQLDQQRIEWETSGLQPATVNELVPGDGPGDALMTTYRVYAKPRAFIADVQRLAGEKQISLADVYVACNGVGNCYGLVNFDIEPAGSSSCTLEMPPDFELLRATIDDSPATLIPLADRRWHLRLGPEQLPQQLSVIFRGQLATASDHRTVSEIPVPWVIDLDTTRTLWTVRGPSGLVITSEQLADHGTSALRQEMIRFSNTASLIESASEIVFDSPTDEVDGWYTPWAGRLAVSDARLSQTRWFPSQSAQYEPAAVDAIRMQQDGIAARMKTASILRDVRAQTAVRPQGQDAWADGQHPGSAVARFSFIGAVGRIALAMPRQQVPPRWPRWLAALALIGLGASVYVLLRRGFLVPWMVEWPYAVGVLAGLAWWLWCSPSILGWVLVTVSLVGALRPPAHCHPMPSLAHHGLSNVRQRQRRY